MCKWPWNWVSGRSKKGLDVPYRKSLAFLEETVDKNMDIKGDSSEGWKEVRRVVEKAAVVLENAYTTRNRTLLEIGMSDTAWSQSEMRKMLSDTGGKAFLVIKCHKSWQSCILVLGGR